MDNTWHLTIGGCRLLVDPWLHGVEVDYFTWFNIQWHRTKPLPYTALPEFDAVLITQKYPDHFHKETLLKLQPKRVFAPKSLEKKLKLLLPDAEITTLSKSHDKVDFNGISIRFLSTSRTIDPIYDAFLLDDRKQSVFLATHGFSPSLEQKKIIERASPCALLITPFNLYKLPVFLGGTVSPGLEAVEKLCELLNPKYVVATHDEDKHAKGLVSRFAHIERREEKLLTDLEWLKNKYLTVTNYKPITLR